MIRKTGFLAAGLGALLAPEVPAQVPDDVPPHSPIINREGEQIGTAVFAPTPNGVLISVSVSDLPPGEHGFHIHETGRCDAGAGFSSAGGHYAPAGASHGYEIAGGHHAGDMPNQFVADDGTLRAYVLNPNVTLRQGSNALADADGAALVIHAGADDYRSQPSGDAGDRVACAIVSHGESRESG